MWQMIKATILVVGIALLVGVIGRTFIDIGGEDQIAILQKDIPKTWKHQQWIN